MTKCTRLWIVATLATPLVTACGADPQSDFLNTSSSAIQGGTNDNTHLFAVGLVIRLARGTALCSGTLLAPNLVATARHCVAAIPANGVVICPNTTFGALTPASDIVVTTDADVRTNSLRVGVSEVIVPSGSDQTSVCGNDIALLILSQNIALPEYAIPVINPPMTDHGVYSTTVTAIGYGVSSPSDTVGTTAGMRRIKQNIALDCIPNDRNFTDCFPSMSADMTATEFASGDGTCEGDSGSNVFEQHNFDAGQWVGFGVLSRGSTVGNTCVGGIYSRFDAWGPLIVDAATRATTAGGYPLPPWAALDGGGALPGGADGGPSSRDAGVSSNSDSGSRGPDVSPQSDGGASQRREAGTRASSEGGTASTVDSGVTGDSSMVAESGGSSNAVDGSGLRHEAGASLANAEAGAPSRPGSIGDTGGQATPPSGGCSCASVGGSASGRIPWPGALAGFAAAVAIRRRRRRLRGES